MKKKIKNKKRKKSSMILTKIKSLNLIIATKKKTKLLLIFSLNNKILKLVLKTKREY